MKTLKLKKKPIFLLLLFIWIATTLFAQKQTNNLGTAFYVAFGRNNDIAVIDSAWHKVLERYVYNVELILRITTTAPTSVSLHFTENPSLNTTFTVDQDMYDYHLTFKQMQAVYSGRSPLPGTLNFKSLQVSSTKPICLVAMSSSNRSVDATAILPVTNLGKEYLQPDVTPNGSSHANAYLIVATEDNTTISQNCPMNPTFTYPKVMNKGEVYFYPYTGSTGFPMHTQVVADKPVAFFQNVTRCTVGDTQNYAFEQILPTNQWGTSFVVPAIYNEMNGCYSVFARIIPKDNAPTDVITGSVIYTDITGKIINTDPININLPNVYHRHHDVKIDTYNNREATSCYITTNKPVGVAMLNAQRQKVLLDFAQPGMTFVPSLGQGLHNVLVSPLDFNGAHVYMEMSHHFIVITPKIGKENTTISINNGIPTPVGQLPKFRWMGVTNTGGTDYAVGLYYFGISDVSNSPNVIRLNTKALIDNPNGVLVHAYGQGSYTNYLYTAGTAGRSFGTTCVTGTVFPFVRWNHDPIDRLFPVTVSLKPVPSPSSKNPLKEVRDEKPLYTTEAVYYDGSVFVPNTPKTPGIVGALGNFGLPIRWKEAIGVQENATATEILNKGEKPLTVNGTTLGLFTIENVKKGEYILEIKREGFVTRWANIIVNDDEPVFYVGHRELIPGDINNDFLVNQLDAAQMKRYIGGDFLNPSTNYNPKYDFNADGKVDQLDYNLILKFNGFWYYHYDDTSKWIETLGMDAKSIILSDNHFAQTTHYSDNHYGQFATSNSRVVTVIKEFENSDEVHLEALLTGELNVGTFQINLHYDPTVVFPITGPGGTEITEKLNGPGTILGDYLGFNQALPNLNGWRSAASGQINPNVESPWTYIMAGGNEENNTNISVEAGEFLPVFNIYFKKRPGQRLTNNSFTYYEKTTLPEVRNLFSRGEGVAYMSGEVNHTNTFLHPSLFARRIPSTIKTLPAEVKGTTVTLKGVANSEGVSKIPVNTGESGGLDRDNITTTGFIYSQNNLFLTVNEYSKKIKVNETEYDFPEITNGAFTLGNDTFYIVSKNNINGTFIEMQETLEELAPEEFFYGYSFMKYRFQTSEEYPVLGKRITFKTGNPCDFGMPLVVESAEPNIILNENEELYLFVKVENDAEFQWFFNDKKIDGATESYYTNLFDATNEGTYSVVILNKCGSLLHFFEVKKSVNVGILGIEKKEPTLEIFPNPAKNSEQITFLFDLPDGEIPKATATIYDIYGRKINKYALDDVKTTVSINLPSGIYVIKTGLNNHTAFTHRIIIQ